MLYGIVTNPYDEVLYPGYPLAQTHPGRLAVLGILFGMQTAPVDRCRVLELGCGDGANLIPAAYGLPGSEFEGIDLAPRPISRAQADAGELGLRNVRFRALNILDVGESFGQFDYIIAHGLYSWVPLEVREKMLAICRDRLNPQGIAYISYNAYPGCHIRNMLREMMLYHVRGISDPQHRAREAKALVRFLNEFRSDTDPYRALAQKEIERLLELNEGVLLHDDLSPVFEPFWFHEFVADAARFGLQYLSEADFHETNLAQFPPEMQAKIGALAGGRIEVQEQYLDLLRCRKFRQTLLCHAAIKLQRPADPECLTRFYVSTAAEPVSADPVISSTSVESFRLESGATASTNHPLTKAAMVLLARARPRGILFRDLLATAQQQAPDSDSSLLAQFLLRMYGSRFVELLPFEPEMAVVPGAYPKVSPIAHLQVRNGKDTVTSLRHASIKLLDAATSRLVLLLDGTLDRPTLGRVFGISEEEVGTSLSELARMALLIN